MILIGIKATDKSDIGNIHSGGVLDFHLRPVVSVIYAEGIRNGQLYALRSLARYNRAQGVPLRHILRSRRRFPRQSPALHISIRNTVLIGASIAPICQNIAFFRRARQEEISRGRRFSDIPTVIVHYHAQQIFGVIRMESFAFRACRRSEATALADTQFDVVTAEKNITVCRSLASCSNGWFFQREGRNHDCGQ